MSVHNASCDRDHDDGEACSTRVFREASQAHARPAASFARADEPARCWLWDNGLATGPDGVLMPYMDGDREQAFECRTARGFTGATCPFHSDHAQSVTDIWNANKEVHTVNTKYEAHDKYAVQGQDGTPYLCYFDKPRNLAFVWDGTRGEQVGVHYDGHSEPESDWFVWDAAEWGNATSSVLSYLASFEAACKAYIDRNYGTPAIVSAFRAGLQGTGRPENAKPNSVLGQAYYAGTEVRTAVEEEDES